MENNDDFKYVIQDTGHVYFGKELTYQEILDKEDVPFKFKAIISAYVSKDTTVDVKLTDHIMTVHKDAFSYRIFQQLKMQIRFFYSVDKKSLSGKIKKKGIHKVCSFDEFQKQYASLVMEGKAQIEDVSISKLALMAISI